MRKHGSNRRSQVTQGARPRRSLRRAFYAAALLAALFAVFWALNRPIRAVRVSGTFRHVAPLAVVRTVARVAHGSRLLSVNLNRVRAAVASLPWVATASVRRIWPDLLAVRIHEQVAAATWNGDGLMNRAGQVFVTGVDDPPPKLVHLAGPPGTAPQVMHRYRAMHAQLAPTGFAIASLSLNARGTWQFALNDGITVRLGRSDVDARFDKFLNVALVIVQRRAQAISYIDMRYMNGFAIGWRAGASPQTTASAGWDARGRWASCAASNGRMEQAPCDAQARASGSCATTADTACRMRVAHGPALHSQGDRDA